MDKFYADHGELQRHVLTGVWGRHGWSEKISAQWCFCERRWRGPGAQRGDARDDTHSTRNTAGATRVEEPGRTPPAPELSLSFLDGSGTRCLPPGQPRLAVAH
jgi:hypothetical protein